MTTPPRPNNRDFLACCRQKQREVLGRLLRLLLIACIGGITLLSFGCASPGGRGKVDDTGRSLDFAIDGEGYFVFESGHGGYLFSRQGAIFLSADAYLVNADGYRLAPAMALAADAHIVNVEPDGRVSYKREGDAGPAVVGYIKLARFDNPAALSAEGKYVAPTAASGEPTTHRPGTGGVGLLKSGFLEN